MTIKQYQKLSTRIINQLDKKYKLNRNEQLTLSQLLEELGELATEINLKNLRHKKAKKKDLEQEFADVFILLGQLAHSFNIDLEKAISDKIKTLQKNIKSPK